MIVPADSAVVVDTMVVSSLIRPGPDTAPADEYRRLIAERRIIVSFVTVTELRYGAIKAGWGELRGRGLERDLASVEDVPRAASFWCDALGYEPRDPPSDDWVVLVPADGAGPGLALGRSETPTQDEPRVHLDLYVDDAEEQAAEIERLLDLGAERVDWHCYPDDPDFVVLADPDGNRFCIIDTSHS